MKLLNKEDINSIIINEKAVHWNQSVIGLLVDTILTPFSWLKNLSAPTVGQINVLAMQWGAEYVDAIRQVMEDEKLLDNSGKSNDDDDDDDDTFFYDEDIYDSIVDYIQTLEELITKLEDIYKNTDTDIYILQDQINNLKLKDIILSTNYKNFIEYVYANNETEFQNIITNLSYDTIIEPHINKIEEIIKNIIKKATDPEYKDKKFITNIIDELIDLKDNMKILNNEVKDEALKIIQSNSSTSQVNTSYYTTYKKNNFLINNRNLSNMINQYSINEISLSGTKKKISNMISDTGDKTDIKIVKPKGKAELPKNIKDLLPIEILNDLKTVPNIKELTAKKLNFANLNSIRYQANYLINKSEKNKDKLQHAFDSNVLNVNNYFQDVIDTKNVMTKATGSIDADTEKNIGEAQNSLNEVTGLKIDKIKEDSIFRVGEVYAFQVSITTSMNKYLSAIIFLTPINKSYNKSIAGQESYLFSYLGSYKYDSKQNKINKWNPFEKVVLPSELVSGLKNNVIVVDTLLIRGLRPGKTYHSIIGIESGKKKSKTNSFLYEKDVLTADDIIATDITQLKDKNFDKTLEKLRTKNTSFKMKIIQRYEVSTDLIKNKTYPDLDDNILIVSGEKIKNTINDFTKLVSAIV